MGPSYMSDSQMGNYLQNLRHNRPARPVGSRPPPGPSGGSSNNNKIAARRSLIEDKGREAAGGAEDQTSRSSSALSYYYDSGSSSTLSNRNSYQRHAMSEQRKLERRESRALRLAMEGLDGKNEGDGARVYDQAKAEVDALLHEHQGPRKTVVIEGQRPDSFDLDNLLDDYDEEPTLHQDKYIPPPAPRAHFAEPKRQSASSDEGLDADVAVRKMSSRGWLSKKKPHDEEDDNEESSVARRLSQKLSLSNLAGRRKSGGPRKSTGRKSSASNFPNETDRIYEDPPEQPAAAETSAARRNPFQRYHSTRDSSSEQVPARPRYRQEIWKNDPTRSRDPGYTRNIVTQAPSNADQGTSNTDLPNGVELRSDDIRAATSKRIGDRSQKLPSPSAVGDRSRPIVSFDPEWKPPERNQTQQRPQGTRPPPAPIDRSKPKSPVPTNYPSIYKLLGEEEPELRGIDRIPSSGSVKLARSQPSPPPAVAAPSLPSPPLEPPEINVNNSTSPPNGANVPQIMVDEDEPAQSTINVPSIAVCEATPERKTAAPRAASNVALHARGQGAQQSDMAPAATSRPPNLFTPMHTRRAGLCAQCALPISGRIVTAAGTRFHPECFKCFHCAEALECVAFYPEPAEKRQERLDRVAQREASAAGSDNNDDDYDDDDDSLRFYCHLDYHELFSPRCKSCKTPIEGEVVVACGAEWHVGHFFCAQCGDPFDPSIPFVEKDGYAWCIKCHTNRYSAKCRKCRKPVTDTVVKALGSEWHVDCFCCGECGGAFDDGRYFVRVPEPGTGLAPTSDEQIVVCFGCEDRRLKD